jgi:PAS domain S-box-containing protein
MDESGKARDRPSSRDGEVATGDISVLYVDDDANAWGDLAAHVDGSETIAVEFVREKKTARTLVEKGGVDVTVVGGSVLTRADDPLLEAPTPTVLYTADDPWDIDDRILGAADSLVEKNIADSEHYLVEKIKGMVRGLTERDDFAADALTRLSDHLDEAVGLFLLDDSGLILWESQPLDSLFAIEPDATTGVSGDDFYARLAELLRDQPETLSTLLGLRHDANPRAGQLVEINGREGIQQFLHASYPVDGGPTGERLAVFVPVTAVLGQYERLELFEELVDNAEDGLYVIDADGRIEYCNESYAAMVGYEPDELVGEHASVLMAEGEIESGQDAVSQALASEGGSGGMLDMTLKHRDGSTVHTSIHGSVRRDKSGAYAGVMGVVRDITERKQRERELEEYRNLVENAVDPMYVLDEDGAIQIVNAAMTNFVGQPKSELIGTNVRDILPLESIDAAREVLRHVLSNDEVDNESFEMWMTSADGEKRFFEVTISAITEGERFVGSVATYRDITERHRRQKQLDLRKQIFARSLRHNIRNETSVIHSYGSILADELDGEHAEMAAAILDASRSLAGTSRKVSQFDWLVEKDAEIVTHELFPLVKRSIEQVKATNEAANVTIDVPQNLRVRAVRDIDVAIKNLVENALQHGANGTPPTVTVTATVEDGTVRVVVADDGPGIPPQEIAVIEEGRETALDHASGLGLWLVKRVVTQSGGELSFDVTDGTHVEVTLARPSDTE